MKPSRGGAHRFKLLLRLSLFLLIAAAFALPLRMQAQPGMPEWTLYFTNSDGKRIALSVEVAATVANRARGLMFRDRLEPNHGMLFIFEEPQNLGFWMKNTKIPLSLAYADKDRVICEIHYLEPYDETPVRSQYPMLFAVEVNRGWFQKNRIVPGSRFEVDLRTHPK